MSTRSLKPVWITATMLILVAAVLMIQSFVVASSARSFVEHVGSLTPGVSGLEDVQKLLKHSEAKEQCSNQDCSVEFQFQTWLSRLHLVRPAAIFGEIQTKSGTVELINILYGEGQSTFVRLTEVRCVACPSTQTVNVQAVSQDGSGKWSFTFSDVPPPLRKELLAINVGCLTKFSGCRDRMHILPASWSKS